MCRRLAQVRSAFLQSKLRVNRVLRTCRCFTQISCVCALSHIKCNQQPDAWRTHCQIHAHIPARAYIHSSLSQVCYALLFIAFPRDYCSSAHITSFVPRSCISACTHVTCCLFTTCLEDTNGHQSYISTQMSIFQASQHTVTAIYLRHMRRLNHACSDVHIRLLTT